MQDQSDDGFLVWSKPRSHMAYSASKALKRRTSPTKARSMEESVGRRSEQTRLRGDVERRSKVMQDRPGPSTVKGKGKMRQRTPPPKKRKLANIQDVEDDDSVADDSADGDADWRYIARARCCRGCCMSSSMTTTSSAQIWEVQRHVRVSLLSKS